MGMGKRRATLTVMIKPASAACNLACSYCFYLDTAATAKAFSLMSDEVADAIIEKSLEAADSVYFVFQGGEPSLAGLPFFTRFVKRATEQKSDGQQIRWAFQTNGLLFDASWAAFFKEHGFLVGISFDGSPRLHDLHRGPNGAAVGAVAKHRVAKAECGFNILSVVTDRWRITPACWRYLVDHGVRYHQYIACMDPIAGEDAS